MKFLITIISRNELLWGGFEIANELPSVQDILSFSEDSLVRSRFIKLIEFGIIPRSEVLSPVISSNSDSDGTDHELNNNDSINDSDNNILNRGPSYEYDTGFGIVKSDLLYSLELDLPFSDIKKAEKILPLQILDQLPFDLPDVHSLIFLPDNNNNNSLTDSLHRYFYHSIATYDLEKIIEETGNAGLKVVSLIPLSFTSSALLKRFARYHSEIGHAGSGEECCITLFDLTEEHTHLLAATGNISTDSFIMSHAKEIILGPKPAVNFHIELWNNQLEAQLSLLINKNDREKNLDTRSFNDNTNSFSKFIYIHCNSLNIINSSKANTSNDSTIKDFSELLFHHDNIEKTMSALNSKTILADQFFDFEIEDYINASLTSRLNLLLSTAFCLSFDFDNSIIQTPKLDRMLSKNIFPNLRHGKFRYRASLAEIKSSLFNEIVPFSLLSFFALLSFIFAIMIPFKDRSLALEKIETVAKDVLPNRFIPKGQELSAIESRIIELEGQLGDLGSLQSLSPSEWLARLSVVITRDIDLELESISITTAGLTFRAIVPDYPTSGRISTLLNKMKDSEPGRFCDIQLKTEDVAIGTTKKSILVEIKLCT
ncbi:MAG TPA: hypothetical protein PKA63_04625 [Oligoflexia bacterium]|nr:hypothetical protein [Oligoflexia bacterium]HMP47935.1 hypothetical protein [Oligoflexia bacterium]